MVSLLGAASAFAGAVSPADIRLGCAEQPAAAVVRMRKVTAHDQRLVIMLEILLGVAHDARERLIDQIWKNSRTGQAKPGTTSSPVMVSFSVKALTAP